jgi:hypothetical protein
VVVPAPEEPVTATMGCFFDMVCPQSRWRRFEGGSVEMAPSTSIVHAVSCSMNALAGAERYALGTPQDVPLALERNPASMLTR